MQNVEDAKGNADEVFGVIIPAYKEADNIGRLCRAILDSVSAAKIMVVDDSPDDLTLRAVEQLGLANVQIMHRSEKGGRGSAVIDGMRVLYEAGCSVIVEMDADFSHPPSQIPELIETLRSRKLDMLIASRYLPGSRIVNWPLQRRVFSKMANLLARALLQVPITDYTNGFRVYNRAAAGIVTQTCGKLGKGFIPLSEILVNLYYRKMAIGEVSTIFTNRIRGESSVNSREIYNAVSGLWKIAGLKHQLCRTREDVANV